MVWAVGLEKEAAPCENYESTMSPHFLEGFPFHTFVQNLVSLIFPHMKGYNFLAQCR